MFMEKTKSIEKLYDTYSVMLYGIALEISPSQRVADRILIETFKRAYKKNVINQEKSSICVTLIKLIIETAHHILMPEELKHNFKLKQFENSQLLHQLLCEQLSVDAICRNNKLTPLEAAQKIREEINAIRSLLSEKNTSLNKQLQSAGESIQ